MMFRAANCFTPCALFHAITSKCIGWHIKKLLTGLALKAQVKLWQGVLNLKWDDKDISNVATHLNNLYYHYPAPNTLVQKK